MQASLPIPQVLLLTFDTQKAMALTMFRFQEYYESRLPELYGKFFSVHDFLSALMADGGEIDYFSEWEGFNFPGSVVEAWLESFRELTPLENRLVDAVCANIDRSKPYYVIAALECAKGTLTHEMCHALWATDGAYKDAVKSVLACVDGEVAMHLALRMEALGYADAVIQDEVQAWLISSTDDELTAEGIDLEVVQSIRRRLKDAARPWMEAL